MQCPNCGNIVEGKKIKSYSNKVARQGAKSLVHGATNMGGTATGAAIGSAILPGIGTVLGAAAGFIGSAMFNQKVNESIDKAGDYIEDEFADIEYEYTCPKCGKRWTSNQNVAHSLSSASSSPEIGQYIQSIVAKLIGISSLSLSNNISLVMKQTTKERLFSIIESDFGLTIPNTVIDGFKTYQDIVDYLSYVVETKTEFSLVSESTSNTVITTNQESQSSKSEQEFLEALKDLLEDGEISERERRMLDRMRQSLGISEQRAAELEASLQKLQLTEDEQEYWDMYREYAEEGAITEKIRKRLDRFASALGISPVRMKELEGIEQ